MIEPEILEKMLTYQKFKIKKLEELIKIKEAEEVEQVQRVNDLQKSERDKSLENKVPALEKFIVKLEENIEFWTQYCYNIEEIDFSTLKNYIH